MNSIRDHLKVAFCQRLARRVQALPATGKVSHLQELHAR